MLYETAAFVESINAEFVKRAIEVLFLIAIATIDLRTRRIPNRLIYPAIPIGLAVSVFVPFPPALSALAAGALAFFGFTLIFILSRGALGAGDVKLAAFIGVILGLDHFLAGLFVGVMVGGLVGLALLLTRKAGLKSSVPYGPSLAAGAILVLFVESGGVNLGA